MAFVYSIREILDIENTVDFTLPPETIELFQQLASSLQSKKANARQWDNVRKQKEPVKVEVKTSPDIIHGTLNRLSDKNYLEILDVILKILKQTSHDELCALNELIFDISSRNRFFSALYANLYAGIIKENTAVAEFFNRKMQDIEQSFFIFFENISTEEEEYDAMCKRLEDNEKIISLAQFLVNLNKNGTIKNSKIVCLASNILDSIMILISKDSYDQCIDHLTEIFFIFYDPKKMKNVKFTVGINKGQEINKIIETLAKAKKSNYKSLTNKSIFKFMDIIGI